MDSVIRALLLITLVYYKDQLIRNDFYILLLKVVVLSVFVYIYSIKQLICYCINFSF
jgi:hypothetical protein